MPIYGPRRREIRQAAVDGLIAANTLAGQRVYPQRFWPTTPGDGPALLVALPIEQKQSKTATFVGAPKFDTMMHLVISARIAGHSDPNGVSRGVEDKLELLCEQVEETLLATQTLIDLAQGMPTLQTEFGITAEGGPVLGEARVTCVLNVFQEYVQTGEPLTDITAQIASQATGAVLAQLNVPLPR